MTPAHMLTVALGLAVLLVGAAPALANNLGCEQAVQLQQQGLSVAEIAQEMGLSVAAVHSLCAQPQSVVVPQGRVPVGAAGQAPIGAAGPAPIGAAGPAPMGAAGPAPMGAAGPAPMGAAGPAPIGSGGGSTSQIKR